MRLERGSWKLDWEGLPAPEKKFGYFFKRKREAMEQLST